jgi:hypothetical protein
MKWFLALSCLVFLPAAAAPQSANGLRLGFAPEAGKPVTTHTADLSISHASAPDHRVTGAIVGAAGGGAFVGLGTAWACSEFSGCSSSHATLGSVLEFSASALLVVGVTSLSGALIGSLFPKAPADAGAKGP